jgi:hypothetical protein
LGRDLRARLLQPEREAAELPGQYTGKRGVVLARAAVRFGAVEQELRSRVLVERGHLELSHIGGKIRRPCGDDNMAALQTRHELRHLGNGDAVVDIVEDHEPRWVGLKPAQDGGDLGRVVARLFLWQVENL